MHPILFHIGPLIVPSYGVAVALAVLAALALAQWTAPRSELDAAAGPRHAWNMIVLAVFAGIAIERLLLIVMNLSDLRHHPQWLLAIAMVHHPLLAGVGIAGGAIAILAYARWARLSLLKVADCLAAPLCLGYAFEQCGALLAGSDFGRQVITANTWSVTYTSRFAALWSGAPVGVPVYPVQVYVAAGALVLAAVLCVFLARPHCSGDIGGVWLLGFGILIFVTEGYRDWEGRGVLLSGWLDIPELAGVVFVLAGAAMLMNWRSRVASA
jgi:phosphatidylglycerol---prolipoprotein diacylglyceryl transferase